MLSSNGIDVTDVEFEDGDKLLMNEKYVVRTNNPAADGNYTAKVSGLKLVDKVNGIYLAQKPGVVSVTTTTTDGSKNTKKVAFKAEYKKVSNLDKLTVKILDEDLNVITSDSGTFGPNRFVYVDTVLTEEDTNLLHYNLSTTVTNGKAVTFTEDGEKYTCYTLNPAKSASVPMEVKFAVTDQSDKTKTKSVTIKNNYYATALKSVKASQSGKLYAGWKTVSGNSAYIDITGADSFVDDIAKVDFVVDKSKYSDAYKHFYECFEPGVYEVETTTRGAKVIHVPVSLKDYNGTNGTFNVYAICYKEGNQAITAPVKVSVKVDKMSTKTKGKYSPKQTLIFSDTAVEGDQISLLQTDSKKAVAVQSETINNVYGAIINGTENNFCKYFALSGNSLRLTTDGKAALDAGKITANDLKGYMNYTVEYGVLQDGTPAVTENKTVAITVSFAQ